MKCKDTSTQVGALISLSAASDVSHSVLPAAHSPLSPSVFVFREQIIPRLCVCLHLSERSRERAAAATSHSQTPCKKRPPFVAES